MTLRSLLYAQREMLLIAVAMTALILVFSDGRSGFWRTALVTGIYSAVAGNLVRYAVPLAARRLVAVPPPYSYVLLLVGFAAIGLIGGGLATAALIGLSEAFDLYEPGHVRNIGRNAIELCVIVSVIAGVMSSLNAQRRASLEETIAGQREEFARAKEIQVGLLPATLPELRGYECAGHWQPARMVGGDYYDLWRIDDDYAGLCIADVSGKGAAAALLMANLQAAVRVAAATAFSPGDLCGRLNAVLKGNLGRGRFVTLFVGLLDLESGRLVFANAGHNPPILLRASGDMADLPGTGPGLGLLARAKYGEATLTLEAGDRLLLFTDGLPEAGIDRSGPLGEERIASALRESTSPGSLVRVLARDVELASGGNDQLHDDLTMLAVFRTA